MERENQQIIDRIIQLRRQLSDLEKKRAEYEREVPGDVWNKIVDICRHIDDDEQRILDACKGKSKHVNVSREKIVEKLEEYQHWREHLREMEALFLAHIVRPGYRLKQAVRQREYLAEEYNRIRRAIETQSYASIEEVDTDIHHILRYSDTNFEAEIDDLKDEALQEKNLYEGLVQFDVDELVEEFQKDHLVRDFKRFVLPSIHPDTSNTEAEEFNLVFEVYENRDYLLMEAYIAQYKGEIEVKSDPDQDPVKIFEDMSACEEQYNRLFGRLERRIDYLRKEMIPEELENSDQLRQRFLQQRDEIRDRIQDESEQILHLRNKIENLSQYFLDRESNG